MIINPRDYQIACVDKIFSFFGENKTGNPLVVMPTGTGKSIVIALFLYKVFERYAHQKIMILTHVKELIDQNYKKLMQFWPESPAGIYSSGLKRRDIYNRIIFAGIGSVAKRAAEFGKINLVIIDEAHLVSPSSETMYRKFIADLTEINPSLRVIGLTATPWRLKCGHLTDSGGLFTHVAFDMSTMEAFTWLIDEGYLVPPVPRKTHTQIDLSHVGMRGGEFIPKELQIACDKDSVTELALNEAVELGRGRKSWLVFASGTEHIYKCQEVLESLGISAGVVHSGTKDHPLSDKERDTAIADHKAGKLRAIITNNVLTTGYDHPPIDLIIMLRPSGSVVLWVQMLGRGTRPVYAGNHDLSCREGRLDAIKESGKENCLVLDFSGNTARLGPINDPLPPRKKGKGSGEAPVKECPVCQVYNHTLAKTCIECGHTFIFKVKIKVTASSEELIRRTEPVVEDFDVDQILYKRHPGRNKKPPTLKVTYKCGARAFTEYVCIEHPRHNFGYRKAFAWWNQRSDESVPRSIEEALHLTDTILKAKQITVWINKKYPEILSCKF